MFARCPPLTPITRHSHFGAPRMLRSRTCSHARRSCIPKTCMFESRKPGIPSGPGPLERVPQMGVRLLRRLLQPELESATVPVPVVASQTRFRGAPLFHTEPSYEVVGVMA